MIGELNEKQKFRHEFKFEIDYGTYLALRQRLKLVMKSDPNTNEEGFYEIRSIYYDNYKDKALQEKINGNKKREKFRIRYYNNDFSVIMLEKKMKHDNLCSKYSARITEEECRKILAGDYSFMLDHESELVKEFYFKLKSQILKPRVLVSYQREPYIYEAGNVRITFDSNVRTTMYHDEFLEKEVNDIKVENMVDNETRAEKIILEVKFDAFIPDIIVSLLQSAGIRQVSFSKYSECRCYG